MPFIARKKFHTLEKLVRGFSNHRRIEIMYLLDEQPELSLVEIAGILRANFKTISEHTCRLAVAGIIAKRAKGCRVCHSLTPRGKSILMFCRTME